MSGTLPGTMSSSCLGLICLRRTNPLFTATVFTQKNGHKEASGGLFFCRESFSLVFVSAACWEHML